MGLALKKQIKNTLLAIFFGISFTKAIYMRHLICDAHGWTEVQDPKLRIKKYDSFMFE